MYKITIKYKDGKEKVINETDYNKACKKADVWGPEIESVYLKEIKCTK